jgi:hypothetical protein
MHTRSEWKVTNVRLVTVAVTQKDSHMDNQPERWSRGKGSGEL